MNIDDIKTIAVIGAGDMGHGIAEVALIAGYKVYLRDIKQEWRILVAINKINSVLRIPFGEVFLVVLCQVFDLYFTILPEIDRVFTPILRILGMIFPHIIGIHEPTSFIKPAYMRAGVGLVTAVPFTEKGCRVTCRFKHFAQSGKIRFEATFPGGMVVQCWADRRAIIKVTKDGEVVY